MAKKAQEKTAGRKAMDAAKTQLNNAKTEDQKKAANKAVEAAKATLRTESGIKFKELATKRVNKAIIAIQGVGKLANARAYLFDADQADKIAKAMVDAAGEVERRFKASLVKGGASADAGGFSL